MTKKRKKITNIIIPVLDTSIQNHETIGRRLARPLKRRHAAETGATHAGGDAHHGDAALDH